MITTDSTPARRNLTLAEWGLVVVLALINFTHILDFVIVMYAGRKVEEGRVEDVFSQPAHPYTQGLLSCMPTIGSDRHPLPVLDRKPEWAL